MSTEVFKLPNGFEIPQVLFGTYLIKGDDVFPSLDAALGAGYRGIDTAEAYGNEHLIGQALNDGGLLKKYGLQREDLFITSKLSPQSQGFEPAWAALKKTLSGLQSDYVDLYLIHWPGVKGESTNAELVAETRWQSWRALQEAQKEGKARNIGVSNYLVRHLEELLAKAETKPAALQIEHHPYLTQRETVEFCRKHDIHYQAYSSLGTTKSCLDLLEDSVVREVASQIDKLPSQVLLKWAVQQGISVLPKSTNAQHIAENIRLFDWSLNEEQMARISSLNRDHHFCWNPNDLEV